MVKAAGRRSTLLPEPLELERICKGLAALDAMMSEDWESRYYSFNAGWSTERAERMASMRNGCGDDWFIVFASGGVFVKSFWHEHAHEDVAAIYAGIPASLASCVTEPAFSMQYVTFGGWHDGNAWTLRGNATPMAEQLGILSGDPASYCAHASEYFEADLPRDAVAHVLAGKTLEAPLVSRIPSERTLADLTSDLAEIDYGHSR